MRRIQRVLLAAEAVHEIVADGVALQQVLPIDVEPHVLLQPVVLQCDAGAFQALLQARQVAGLGGLPNGAENLRLQSVLMLRRLDKSRIATDRRGGGRGEARGRSRRRYRRRGALSMPDDSDVRNRR